MSKIELDNIASGFSTQKINANFQKIKDEINNKMLSRNPGNETNVMLDDLDMNSNRILNLPKPLSLTEPVRLIDLQDMGEGGGSGGGIVYAEPTTEFVQGITYFNPKTFELVMSYPDDDGEQYITFPLVGSLISYEAGPGEGGSGGGITYTNAKPTTLTVQNTYFNPETFELTMTYQDANSTQYVTFPLQPSTYNIEPGPSVTNGVNLGAGTNLFKVKTGSDLQFKTLVPGSNVTITSDDNTVTISATSTGGGGAVVDTNQNTVATGAGIFKITSTNISYFRRIRAGDTSLTVTENSDDIAIIVNAVPYAKVNNFPTASLAGRFSSGVGAIEAITVGSGLSLAGGVLSATGGGGATLNPALSAINALFPSANTMPYYTGSSTASLTPLSSLARDLLFQSTTSNMIAQLGITVVSNGNGVSLRIPTSSPSSGIQICWRNGLLVPSPTNAYGTGFYSNDATWNFPQAFTSAPVVTGTAVSNPPVAVIGGTILGNASTTVRTLSHVSNPGDSFVNLFAIGTY